MKRIDWTTREWLVAADPAALQMDAEKLSKLDSVLKSEYSNTNGIVVARNGAIAYERYYNGYGQPLNGMNIHSRKTNSYNQGQD